MGDEFIDAYAELRDAQKAKGVDLDNLADADPKDVRRTARALRLFLVRQMLDESVDLFLLPNVVKGDETLKTFHDLDQAEEHVAQHEGTRVVDALPLPTRVIVELLEWVVELHTWPLRRMLNAAEASMDMAAEDDAERQRNRAQPYDPPKDAAARPPTVRSHAAPPAWARARSAPPSVVAEQLGVTAEKMLFRLTLTVVEGGG
ncbi:hypothetical protein [Streptomyces sp. NPDC051677]|uniref:hypothetical protein n=1 Tax=Streptomyces sp. NPDC051677 TaxID=3365669 RepID=UPI0037D23863